MLRLKHLKHSNQAVFLCNASDVFIYLFYLRANKYLFIGANFTKVKKFSEK
jgi:hypothetical protein